MNWARQRVLLTGGNGFLGRYVKQLLTERGCQCILIPRSQRYDLRQPTAVAQLFTDAQPTMVIHLAALTGGIQANSQYPGTFFYDNMMINTLVMEQARLHRVEKFVGLGSVCAYPKHTPVPFLETALWDGYPEETNAAYGLVKKMMLVQGQAYWQQYDFHAIHLLMTNLYGPGDNFNLHTCHVIPALIRKCLIAIAQRKNELIVWGDGSATREFLYVADAAEAILCAAELYDEPEPLNIGSGFEVSIRELAETIARETGFDGKITWDRSKPNGQPRRCLDSSRALSLLGFQAQTDLVTGLRETIRWYLAEKGVA